MTEHCTLCAYELVQDKRWDGDSRTRVMVGGVFVCLTHDLEGPPGNFPERVMRAAGAQ